MKRDVNIRNFTISYMREGGFAKKELTDTAKKTADAKYQKDRILLIWKMKICRHLPFFD